MPSFMPDASVDRVLDEKLTFQGVGVDALLDVVDALRIGTSIKDLPQEAREVWDVLTNHVPEEKIYESDLVRYLPETEQNREFEERLILRGWEVEAVCLMLDRCEIDSPRFDLLRKFKSDFIDKGKKAHLDTRDQ